MNLLFGCFEKSKWCVYVLCGGCRWCVEWQNAVWCVYVMCVVAIGCQNSRILTDMHLFDGVCRQTQSKSAITEFQAASRYFQVRWKLFSHCFVLSEYKAALRKTTTELEKRAHTSTSIFIVIIYNLFPNLLAHCDANLILFNVELYSTMVPR